MAWSHQDAEKRLKKQITDGDGVISLRHFHPVLEGDDLPMTASAHFIREPLKTIELDLSNNRLLHLPDPIMKLSNLRVLALDGNLCHRLPAWIGDLTSLRDLSAAANKIHELPESFSKLSKLRSLNLSNNNMRSVPPCIAELVFLRTLLLDHNDLTSLPEWLAGLKHLRSLGLSNTQIDHVPKWLQIEMELSASDASVRTGAEKLAAERAEAKATAAAEAAAEAAASEAAEKAAAETAEAAEAEAAIPAYESAAEFQAAKAAEAAAAKAAAEAEAEALSRAKAEGEKDAEDGPVEPTASEPQAAPADQKVMVPLHEANSLPADAQAAAGALKPPSPGKRSKLPKLGGLSLRRPGSSRVGGSSSGDGDPAGSAPPSPPPSPKTSERDDRSVVGEVEEAQTPATKPGLEKKESAADVMARMGLVATGGGGGDDDDDDSAQSEEEADDDAYGYGDEDGAAGQEGRSKDQAAETSQGEAAELGKGTMQEGGGGAAAAPPPPVSAATPFAAAAQAQPPVGNSPVRNAAASNETFAGGPGDGDSDHDAEEKEPPPAHIKLTQLDLRASQIPHQALPDAIGDLSWIDRGGKLLVPSAKPWSVDDEELGMFMGPVVASSAVGRRRFQTPKEYSSLAEDGPSLADVKKEAEADGKEGEEVSQAGAPVYQSLDEEVGGWLQKFGRDMKPSGRAWAVDGETEAFMAALTATEGNSGGKPFVPKVKRAGGRTPAAARPAHEGKVRSGWVDSFRARVPSRSRDK